MLKLGTYHRHWFLFFKHFQTKGLIVKTFPDESIMKIVLSCSSNTKEALESRFFSCECQFICVK